MVRKRMSSRQAVSTVTVPVSTTCTMSDVQSDRVFSENDFVRTRSNYEERNERLNNDERDLNVR
jgi:hypothetical protein